MARKITFKIDPVSLHFIPVGRYNRELVAELDKNKEHTATVTTKRSTTSTNLYWAGLGYAVENFDEEMSRHYPRAKALHRAILLKLGYTSEVYRIDGGIQIVEDSTRFEAMESEDFEIFYERAQALLVEWLGFNPVDAWKLSKEYGDNLRRENR